MKLAIGIDTGGTCTDAVAYDYTENRVVAKGKGYVAEARSGQMVMVECRCMTRRRSLQRLPPSAVA